MNKSETIGKLTAAVTEVIKARGYVKSDARNDHFKYSYLSDEAVLGHVRGSMADNGLMLQPHGVEYEISGSIITTTTSFVLAHVSGEWITIQVVAQGQDKADKGAYKAATGALKYALRQAFLIPTGDDPEKARRAEVQAATVDLDIDDSGHSKFWRSKGKGICTRLGNAGTPYAEVAAWCESMDKGRPSQWAGDRVFAMVNELVKKDSPSQVAFLEWKAAQ